MFKKRLLVALFFLTTPATAGTVYYALPSGVTTGNCASTAPCEPNYAMSIASNNDQILLIGSGGAYAQTLILTGKRLDIKGDCSNLSSVQLTGGITVGDLAVGIIHCLTIATGNGIGIYVRQFSIADWANVIWGDNAIDIQSAETGRANCVGPETLAANTFHFLHSKVADHSSIVENCDITIQDHVSTYSFLHLSSMGIINIGAAKIHGNTVPGTKNGVAYPSMQWVIDNSELDKASVVVPGTGPNIKNALAVIR